jgi:HSP20 family protein
MGNLIRKKSGMPLSRQRRSIEDPFSSGFEEWSSSPRALRRLFDELLSASGEETGVEFVPSLELSETDDDYVMKAELPGMTEDDVKVEVDEDNNLTIRGEKKCETKESRRGYEYSERSYGQFMRTIQMPNNVDASKIEASFKNGVLELHVPKTEKVRAREIPIGKKGLVEKIKEKVAEVRGEGNGSKEPQAPPPTH